MSAALECRDVSVDYGSVRALSALSLAVEPGETIAVLGPSGSGKTTLAHAVAGFVPISEGLILIEGEVVSRPGWSLAPERRRIGVVFQNYALWPHLDAIDNVAFPMRRSGLSRAAARAGAAELMDRLGIGNLTDRRPSQLSGGQQQRVGLARALARRASLYLFDEPTAHLDAAVRTMAQAEIGRTRKEGAAAAIYSTHDATEALAIADRVVLLRQGRLVQEGTPQELYERPVDLWAAELTGPAATVVAPSDGYRVEIGGTPLPLPRPVSQPGRVEVLVRPDWISPGGDIPGTVAEVLYRGPFTDYRIRIPEGTVLARVPGPPRFEVGEHLGWTIEKLWVTSSSVPRSDVATPEEERAPSSH